MKENEKIELDFDNQEFNYASEFVKHTDKLVYLIPRCAKSSDFEFFLKRS